MQAHAQRVRFAKLLPIQSEIERDTVASEQSSSSTLLPAVV